MSNGKAEPPAHDKTLNIFERMFAIMKAISYIQKEKEKVNNQYTFVSHDGVTKAIRPLLLSHGVYALPNFTEHSRDGNITDTSLVMHYINIDKPEEFIEVKTFGQGVDSQDKGPGKAMSYAVKYNYLKAFCLETGDDPERDNIDAKPAEKTIHNPNENAEVDAAIAGYSQSIKDALNYLRDKKSWTRKMCRSLVIKENFDEVGVAMTLQNETGIEVTPNLAKVNEKAAKELQK